ncbi:MAG: metal-dependent hydrolase [Bacteroidota bacterium]
MDLVTQGLVGAALAQAAAPREEVRRAALVGALAGVLPDADTLIQSAADPLLVLEYHRHFTHALVFIPVGALLVALLLWPMRKHLPFGRRYGYALLGLSMAGLLDACTSYGTHLLWPFVDAPVSWSIIAIVDPAFSLGLAVGVVGALGRQRAAWARWGVVWGLLYLGLGVVQQQRAAQTAEALIAQRGHAPEATEVKPTLANLVLWRVVYQEADTLFAMAVRPGLRQVTVYEGTQAPRFTADTTVAQTLEQLEALRRFERLSEGWLVRHPTQPAFVGDARFAMLPTSTRPLWGVVFEASASPPYRFENDRTLSDAGRAAFIAMLRGDEVQP